MSSIISKISMCDCELFDRVLIEQRRSFQLAINLILYTVYDIADYFRAA